MPFADHHALSDAHGPVNIKLTVLCLAPLLVIGYPVMRGARKSYPVVTNVQEYAERYVRPITVIHAV